MTKKDKAYFQKFKTIRSFGREIYSGIHTLNDALEEQINLKEEIDKFKESTKPKNLDTKEKKALAFENEIRLLKGKQKVLNAFESKILPTGKQTQGKCPFILAQVAKVSDHAQIKMLTPEQMLQRLPITFAQVKAYNTYENLQKEICQIIYSLYRPKEIAKKVYERYKAKWTLYL